MAIGCATPLGVRPGTGSAHGIPVFKSHAASPVMVARPGRFGQEKSGMLLAHDNRFYLFHYLEMPISC